MTAPGELAAVLERSDLPPGEGEHFTGYGIMTQPFRSGHILALRHLMTTLGSHLPDPLWRNRVVLATTSRVAGPALQAGAVRLQAHVPSGQWFRVKIPKIWATTEVGATMHGEDLGPAAPPSPPEEAPANPAWPAPRRPAVRWCRRTRPRRSSRPRKRLGRSR
jgi:hypothetical protein